MQNDKIARYLRQFKEAIEELRDGERDDVVLDITDETELMIEVEDILDELHTLKKILKDQEGAILDINKVLAEFDTDSHKRHEVNMRTLTNHLLRIDQMEEAANKADTAVRFLSLPPDRLAISPRLAHADKTDDLASSLDGLEAEAS